MQSGPPNSGHEQAASYRRWEAGVRRALKADRSKRLVILEAGCGLRVPTVRMHSERLLKLTKKYGTRLVRINPETPGCAKEAAATIAVQDGCLDALRKIDAKMKEACGRADAA